MNERPGLFLEEELEGCGEEKMVVWKRKEGAEGNEEIGWERGGRLKEGRGGLV